MLSCCLYSLAHPANVVAQPRDLANVELLLVQPHSPSKHRGPDPEKMLVSCMHLKLLVNFCTTSTPHANLMLSACKHFLYFLHRQRHQVVISHSSGQLQSPLGSEQTPVATSSHIQACLFPTDIYSPTETADYLSGTMHSWITVIRI